MIEKNAGTNTSDSNVATTSPPTLLFDLAGCVDPPTDAVRPGWVAATHGSYKLIEDAGISVGRIKPKTN